MNSETDGTKPFFSLIIPAYNEAGRIEWTLENAEDYLMSLGKPCELIIVDDGSSDQTLDKMREYKAKSSLIRLISYEPNRGKGYAVRQGVFASRGEYVGFSDADFSAPLQEFPKLFEVLKKGYDIAIGSRAVKESEIPVHQPLYRELGGRGLNLIIRMLATPGIHDTQCGFKLFRGDVARDIFGRCFINGWGFDVEVLYVARKLGYTINEAGVKWSHAEGSKIRPFRAALRVILDIIRIRAHNYGITGK